MMKRRDLELLSSYLDGELKPSDSAKLEARLKTDPELVSVLEDLRAARNLLRRLPTRKAPRNFTLTRKMVGLNPPLPRAYPAFRFATVFATLLFFFSFGLNTLSTQLASQAPAYGMGGGAGETELFAAEAPQADAFVTEESVPQEEPSAAMVPPASTMVAPMEDTTRIMETPFEKTGEAGNVTDQPLTQPKPLISPIWQIVFAVLAILSALFMVIMRQLAASRWR